MCKFLYTYVFQFLISANEKNGDNYAKEIEEGKEGEGER